MTNCAMMPANSTENPPGYQYYKEKESHTMAGVIAGQTMQIC